MVHEGLEGAFVFWGFHYEVVEVSVNEVFHEVGVFLAFCNFYNCVELLVEFVDLFF